jgi:tetratricopeptide (TPR) repeat protein
MADKLLKLRKTCMFLCAALVFVYLTLLCFANPSPELLFALAVELASFAGFLYFGDRRSQSASGQAGEAVMRELSKQYAAVQIWTSSFAIATTLFWVVATLALTIDCFAFCTAFFGAQRISLAVYRAVPISRALGMHPGASLEVLAGAYVEAHKYDRAMPLYQEVLALRLLTFGKIHKEIAAIYCDFGDLNTHQNKLVQAESCYRIALGISTNLLGDKGSGRAYTRLADCLRDQRRYEEAAKQYQSAYDMRLHQFGKDSTKVGETLAEWAKMLRMEGLDQEAATMQARVDRIQNAHREPSSLLGAFCSLLFFALSLLVSNFFLGRKGVLTELVVGKIKASVDTAAALTALTAAPASTASSDDCIAHPAPISTASTAAKRVSRSQLSRLITLYRFQKKYDEAEHYAALLVSLGKD